MQIIDNVYFEVYSGVERILQNCIFISFLKDSHFSVYFMILII